MCPAWILHTCSPLARERPISRQLRASTGLFRKPEPKERARKRRRKALASALAPAGAVTLGSLDDLRAASKGGVDPSGAPMHPSEPLQAVCTEWRTLSGQHGHHSSPSRSIAQTCSSGWGVQGADGTRRGHIRAGQGSTVVAADVMWSDPSAEPGLQMNDSRGVGVILGADVTEVGDPPAIGG